MRKTAHLHRLIHFLTKNYMRNRSRENFFRQSGVTAPSNIEMLTCFHSFAFVWGGGLAQAKGSCTNKNPGVFLFQHRGFGSRINQRPFFGQPEGKVSLISVPPQGRWTSSDNRQRDTTCKVYPPKPSSKHAMPPPQFKHLLVILQCAR